jgi:uncharacterized membrane protein
MLNAVLLILGFGLCGALIKYIDQAYDVGAFDKRKALFFGIIAGVLMGSFVAIDSVAGMIFLSFVIFAFFTRKVDNPPFYIVATLTFLIPMIAATLYNLIIQIDLFIFGSFIFSGIIDEEGNRRAYNHNFPRLIAQFFRYRMFMKVVVFILALLNYYDIIYFVAFMAYDLAYLGVAIYSQKVLKKKLGKQWTPKNRKY